MNIISSTLKYKCPRCRKGDLYKKPFKFSDPLAMNESCQHCDLPFEPEYGYYLGAMFISYVWTGFACLFIVGFLMIVLKWSVGPAFAVLLTVAALSYFWILRVSRSMYIHLDVRYDPEAAKEQ